MQVKLDCQRERVACCLLQLSLADATSSIVRTLANYQENGNQLSIPLSLRSKHVPAYE